MTSPEDMDNTTERPRDEHPSQPPPPAPPEGQRPVPPPSGEPVGEPAAAGEPSVPPSADAPTMERGYAAVPPGGHPPPHQPPHQPHQPPHRLPPPPPDKKRSYWWAWLIGAVVVIAIVVGLVLALRGDGTTEVPDLSGLTLGEAAEALSEADLALGGVTFTTDFPDTFAEGQVVGQDPAAGREVDAGTSVDLVVARGEEGVQVPDLVGLPVDEATQALEAAGFAFNVVQTESEADEGTVVDQSPEPGTRAAPGSTVTLVVSAGTAETLVPRVVGMTQEEATSTLEAAGFEVRGRSTFDETVEAGIVISQSPEAGTAAERGTTVEIYISGGPSPQAQVPNVVGMTEAEAASALEGAGFRAVPGNAYDDDAPVGQVISQDPEAGTTAERGSPVYISVSIGPEPPETATVPDVKGREEAQARQDLEDAGYLVSVARAFSETVAAGSVIAQAPAAGVVTEPGINVGILVSEGPRPDSGFIIVPDVRELSLEEATAVLEDLGLEVVSYEVPTQIAPQGQVVAQLPAPESSVPPRSTILLLISAGLYPTPR